MMARHREREREADHLITRRVVGRAECLRPLCPAERKKRERERHLSLNLPVCVFSATKGDDLAGLSAASGP